ncbi:MAG: MoxR family ATPase, partial [Actinomycetota bacterium]|nr:MoxR family ATPase [Actinomycetota bacterium]
TLDWAQALHSLGATSLDLESAALTLGAVVKYREDAERVRASLDAILTT